MGAGPGVLSRSNERNPDTRLQMETTLLSQTKVAELVTQDYRRAAVFKGFGIDFCCGGGITLQAACEKQGVAIEDVATALEESDGRGSNPHVRVESWTPAFLADYIVNEHHTYVRRSIPVLRAFTQKVARVHGGGEPSLIQIAMLFEKVAEEMESHMHDEETVVFPRIKAEEEGGQNFDEPLADLINRMESEHDLAGSLMKEIRRLSNDYQPPADACNTYRATFVELEGFEDDLHRHVHLENNILFPRALQNN